MPLILNIDTSTELASVCLNNNAQLVAYRQNEQQKEHASFVHLAIQQIMNEAAKELSDLDAIAVTSGPGSYTGLRVGMATAKGLCFALNKPLITIGTLEVMTQAAIAKLKSNGTNLLYCPMIDARRMEVFTAIYNAKFEEVLQPQAIILDENTFNKYDKEAIVFFGSGSIKLQQLATPTKATFEDVSATACDLGTLAEKAFAAKKFADAAYSKPNYLKEFYTTSAP